MFKLEINPSEPQLYALIVPLTIGFIIGSVIWGIAIYNIINVLHVTH